MTLSEAQKKYLRGLGHKLKPTVMIGDGGLTDAQRGEYATTLEHHELIKVKVRVGDRQDRDAIIADLCTLGPAELVQRIGNVALLYRAATDDRGDNKRIRLPSR